MVERFQEDEAEPLFSITGIVLAGGESRRMGGVNKALLKIGGRPVIERIVDVLTRVFREIILIANNPEPFRYLGLPIYPDIMPGRGSLGGLLTGLRESPGGAGFLTACDMPFLNEALIRLLAGLLSRHDVVIPNIDGMLEPLHAVYSKRCIPNIEALLQADDLKILNLFPNVDVLEVREKDLVRMDPHLAFAMNLNTPEDFERAERLALRLEDRGAAGS
jgi:molybdopterin-guanine dinucleotide biosynthesis protein A